MEKYFAKIFLTKPFNINDHPVANDWNDWRSNGANCCKLQEFLTIYSLQVGEIKGRAAKHRSQLTHSAESFFRWKTRRAGRR